MPRSQAEAEAKQGFHGKAALLMRANTDHEINLSQLDPPTKRHSRDL